jgi:chromate transporter
MTATSAQRSDARVREPGNHVPATEVAAGDAAISLGSLLGTFLRMGTTSFGVPPRIYLFDELVRRRGWLTEEDYSEGQILSRLLPGPSAPNNVIFAVHRLRGTTAALLCLAVYALPGVLLLLALAATLSGWEHPAWLDGSMRGLSVGVVALVFSSGLRLIPGGRRPRYGLLLAGLVFVTIGVLRWDLLVVLATVGAASLWLNRPGLRGGTHA